MGSCVTRHCGVRITCVLQHSVYIRLQISFRSRFTLIKTLAGHAGAYAPRRASLLPVSSKFSGPRRGTLPRARGSLSSLQGSFLRGGQSPRPRCPRERCELRPSFLTARPGSASAAGSARPCRPHPSRRRPAARTGGRF